MKKLFPIVLCLLLLTGCSDSADFDFTFPTVGAIHESPTTIATTETEPTQPPHSAYYDPMYDVEDVITWFSEVNFDAEFANGGDPGLIQKWETPIYYQVFGEPTEEDLKILEAFAQWVNTVEGFPGMYSTTDLNHANMKIYFCTAQGLLDLMGNDYAYLDGAVTYWYTDNSIYTATVAIRTDLSQHLRNSVIQEELYNGLGPVNDTSLREDSIIFSGFSEPQELTAVDELLMKLLYDPQIQCGMNADACAEILRSLYY